jgi:hypothetical protein
MTYQKEIAYNTAKEIEFDQFFGKKSVKFYACN